jgi:hypothetical protein
MNFSRNQKRRLGIAILLMGALVWRAGDVYFPSLRWWFWGLFVTALAVGLILNREGWREDMNENLGAPK